MNEEIELMDGPWDGKVIRDVGYPGFIPLPWKLGDGTSAVAFYEIELGMNRAWFKEIRVSKKKGERA